MKEKYVLQTLSSLGKKFAGYDTIRYLAVTTFQRKYKRSRYMFNSKSVIYRSMNAKINQFADEINNDKLKVYTKMNKSHQKKGVLSTILSIYKENRQLHEPSPPINTRRKPVKPLSQSFAAQSSPSSPEHKRQSLSLANGDLTKYFQHYADVFSSHQMTSTQEKIKPVRMSTMEYNKEATRQFESVIEPNLR